MLKLIHIAVMALTIGCGENAPVEPDGSESLTLVLNISNMETESRAATAASDTEPINTLRVIIAKPDGKVEVNRLFWPNTNALGIEDLKFRISLDDYKIVFLIANEAATGLTYDDIDSFSPEALTNPGPGDKLLGTRISQLPTSKTSVPMTAMYRLGTRLDLADKTGANSYEVRYRLTLMRTVTKYTFNIYNYRNTPVEIESIGINSIKADGYYLFPRVRSLHSGTTAHYLDAQGSTIIESGTGEKPKDGGTVSATPFSDYFRSHFVASDTGTQMHDFTDGMLLIEPTTEAVVKEYYYYESNLPADAAADKPYSLHVRFDGKLYSVELNGLPTLPRNTHVVVNMKFNDNIKIEVLPYGGVTLNPGFGN